jgi:hypothetical protein
MHIYLLPNRKNGLQEILKFGGMTILCRERGYLLGVGESFGFGIISSFDAQEEEMSHGKDRMVVWWWRSPPAHNVK